MEGASYEFLGLVVFILKQLEVIRGFKGGGDIISIFFQKDHSGSSVEEGLRLEVMGVTKVIQQDTEIAYEKPMRTVESGDRQEGPDFRDIPDVGATGLDD